MDTLNNKLAAALIFFGICGGVSIWALAEAWDSSILQERSLLAITEFACALFVGLLALSGPVSVRRAVLPAFGFAVILAALTYSGAGRHAGEVGPFLDLIYPFIMLFIAKLIALPFIASVIKERGGWRNYPLLFDLSWQIVVRFLAATLFTSLFWGLLTLSDALLRIVGIPLLSFVQFFDVVPWALTGGVFGLALAVVLSLDDVISPALLLRLLRLFLPFVLIVTAVFLVALPLSGWQGVLSDFSTGATLMSVCIAAIVLVSVSVDQDNSDAVQSRFLRGSTAALAICVPLVAGLAIWAVWARVGQYGWTPNRLLAGTIAGALGLYGVCYGAVWVRPWDWMAGIRRVNIGMAMTCLAICLVWLSPFFVPEQISARDQLVRATQGLKATELPLNELAREWGHSGKSVLAEIREQRPDLISEIDAAESGEPRRGVPLADRRQRLVQILPVYPSGTELAETSLERFKTWEVDVTLAGCDQRVPEGPGCALFVLPKDPTDATRRAFLFYRTGTDGVVAKSLILNEETLEFRGAVSLLQGAPLRVETLSELHKNQGEISERNVPVLQLGSRTLFVHN